MIDRIWCDKCNRLRNRSQLRVEGTFLFCPECGNELRTYSMEIYECPDCHRRILCASGKQSKIVCSCRTEQAKSIDQHRSSFNAPGEMQERKKEEVRDENEKTNGSIKQMINERQTEIENAADQQQLNPEKHSKEDDVQNISWKSSSDDEIAFAPPRGKHIQYGDSLTLEDQQAACFACGGKTLWVKGPAFRTVGYDSREKEEILLAYQHGENTGLPPMVNTSIMIYDLRKRIGLTGESETPVLLAEKIGFLPEFAFNLSIEAPEKLRAIAFEKEVPGLKELKEHVLRQLTKWLSEKAEPIAAETKTKQEAIHAIREHLKECLDEVLKENQPGYDWGLKAEEVVLKGCSFFQNLCPICHQPVRERDAECVKGHPLRWCPVCGEIIEHNTCPNGHQFRFCRLCGREVLLKNGKCSRHGSLGMQ